MTSSRNRAVWTAFLIFLGWGACFRSLDLAKVKCVDDTTCPSGYTCLMDQGDHGRCVRGFPSADGPSADLFVAPGSDGPGTDLSIGGSLSSGGRSTSGGSTSNGGSTTSCGKGYGQLGAFRLVRMRGGYNAPVFCTPEVADETALSWFSDRPCCGQPARSSDGVRSVGVLGVHESPDHAWISRSRSSRCWLNRRCWSVRHGRGR